jgi:hypothetical protein
MTVYIATWPQHAILNYFWDMARTECDRIALLQQLAGVAVRRPPDWDKKAIRRERIPRTPEACFACKSQGRDLFWHHVIAVDHGGDNAILNLVPLCLRCHAKVHPWLEQQAMTHTDGFTTLGELTQKLGEDVLTFATRKMGITKKRTG